MAINEVLEICEAFEASCEEEDQRANDELELEGKPYCTQNAGDCATCSLKNYGRDCRNERIL